MYIHPPKHTSLTVDMYSTSSSFMWRVVRRQPEKKVKHPWSAQTSHSRRPLGSIANGSGPPQTNLDRRLIRNALPGCLLSWQPGRAAHDVAGSHAPGKGNWQTPYIIYIHHLHTMAPSGRLCHAARRVRSCGQRSSEHTVVNGGGDKGPKMGEGCHIP